MINQHHGGIGDINTHFHNGGGNEHINRTRAERLNGGLLISTGKSPMQKAEAKFREHFFLKSAVFLNSGSQFKLVGFIHQWEHDVGLTPLGNLLAN